MIAVWSALVAFLDIYKKKSKFVFCFTVFFLWVLMAFTYGTADESLYLSRYNEPELWAGRTEILYMLIIDLARKFELNFQQFKAVITAIQLLLVSSTVNKYAKYPNFVMLLYFIVPFPLNVAQMRHALATSIFIWFSRFLLDNSKTLLEIRFYKRLPIEAADFWYVVGVGLATMVHTASILWLILLVAKKCTMKTTLITTLLANVVIGFLLTPMNVLRIIQFLAPAASGRIGAYVSVDYQNSEWRHYSQILLVLFVGFMVCILYRFVKKHQKQFEYSEKLELTAKMNVAILVIASIILRYTSEAYRLQESMFILNYILITNVMVEGKWKLRGISMSHCKLLGMIAILVMGSAWFLIYHYLISDIMRPLFSQNIFIDIIF